jgi:3-deoxy-manno-octulosonate cytidylyltransferase (CMP-KDO synthetase)
MVNLSATAFTALIPARRASSRLPDKALLDIAGLPMVIRVAQQALKSHARAVVVATDDADIERVCAMHGVQCVMTSAAHPSGSDRLAQACDLLGLGDDELVVNVQGDEPLISPDLINEVAQALQNRPDCDMATAAHPIADLAEFSNPNVVKTVLDAHGTALYFSRAPMPWWRDANADGSLHLPQPAPLRHLGIYAYRCHFLKQFPTLKVAPIEHIEALEQLRALWHGHRIAVHITHDNPSPGVDTQQDLDRVRQLFSL